MFLQEDDPNGSPLGSKVIGELGICGAGAAVLAQSAIEHFVCPFELVHRDDLLRSLQTSSRPAI